MSRHRIAIAVAVSGALALALCAVPAAGMWLVVNDPLEPSRAAVVFGGDLPFRAMEAAAIYKQGWVGEVWITNVAEQAAGETLARLGIHRPPDHAYSVEVVERLGVPKGVIRVLPESVVNTADEVRVIAAHMKNAGGGSVILVTSKYHTRRVRLLWRRAAADGSKGLVRYASDDPFRPGQWWRTTDDVIAVAREWVGLVNAVAGFPIKSVRD